MGEALLGDLDLDGTVVCADFRMLSANFSNNDVAREDGDLNVDGAVSLADFLILSVNFGKQQATAEPMSRSEITVGVLATDKFFSQGGDELMVSERIAGVVSWKVSATAAREQANSLRCHRCACQFSESAVECSQKLQSQF